MSTAWTLTPPVRLLWTIWKNDVPMVQGPARKWTLLHTLSSKTMLTVSETRAMSHKARCEALLSYKHRWILLLTDTGVVVVSYEFSCFLLFKACFSCLSRTRHCSPSDVSFTMHTLLSCGYSMMQHLTDVNRHYHDQLILDTFSLKLYFIKTKLCHLYSAPIYQQGQ